MINNFARLAHDGHEAVKGAAQLRALAVEDALEEDMALVSEPGKKVSILRGLHVYF